MDIIRNLFALVVFVCLAVLLLYIGAALLLVALVVGAIAAVWYGIKFYFIRKELTAALREHEETRFHHATRQQADTEGAVIEGEFVEIGESDAAEGQEGR